ncbi:LysM repeat protein [Kineococcus xinjiangensis]|uniref:LysM repeat protein n=1 Tax=Kineococcus xinjiangensis TaxID=512762 RepID=A0A2S6IM87_9ACTN|nr:LysM peptidoglycan-binding domain-containing protein [Kineococcus xinjiangensis]PPK95276.1 LysM repeat protein [Kineococcus xinjiangensis]
MPTTRAEPDEHHRSSSLDPSAEDTSAMPLEPTTEPQTPPQTGKRRPPAGQEPEQQRSGAREARARSPWLLAALVGAAAPGVMPAPASAAVPAVAPATAPPASALPTVTLPGLALPTAAVPAAAPAGARHTVVAGETLSHIAARTGTTVKALREANGLDARGFIREGQVLTVPAAAAAAPAAPATYPVSAGETLSHIAVRTGTTVEALREANGLDARGFIREGQVLTLPAGAGAPAAPAPSAATHTVRAGETLSGIAGRTGSTVKALREANGLDARGFIREGQVLTIPEGAARRAGAKPAAVAPVRAGSVAEAAAANRAHLARQQVPSRKAMREIVRREALRQGLDPALALAIAHQESGFNMRAVSYANAIGAMQVIPTSGEWASQLVGRHLDLFDAEDNATAGVAILRHLTRNNPDDIAIASYYQGNASVRARGMYDDTRRYVANVQTLRARFS